jgi:hypothetical protein
VLALLVGLALIDERVRERLSRLYSSGAGSGEIATAGAQLRDMAEVLAAAVRDQSIDQAPLVIFGLAAIVLLLFMLRT